MSSLKKNQAGGPNVATLAKSIKQHMDAKGDSFVSPADTTNLISMESIGAPNMSTLQTAYANVQDDLKGLLSNLGFESFGDATLGTPEGREAASIGLEAGAIAALAAGNPAAYARAAYQSTAHGGQGITVVDSMASGHAGDMDYRADASLESFDEVELRNHLPYSIAFNVFAARQDDFGEAFYPTTVVTPDQAGLDVTVARMTVFNEVRHAATGKAIDFGKKNLIDAAVDHTILADEATRLVPHKAVDNSNNDWFVPATAVASYGIVIAGITVPTAPLLVGQEVNILGLSQYTPLMGAGVMDNTDAVDARVQLASLYLLTAVGEKAIKFNVKGLPRSSFVKSVEGNSREMNLVFSTRDLIIDKNTRAADGSVIASLSAIAGADYTCRLSVNVTGSLNTETGNLNVLSTAVTVVSIVDVNSNEIALDSGAGQTAKNLLQAMPIIGYDLFAARTNSNRRTRGLQLDTVTETERYTIPLGSPLSIPSTTSSNKDAADLKALITAARLRSSNNAVTQLFAYADILAAYVRGPKRKGVVPQIPGMGRYLVEPFFERHTLDLEASINSIKSHEKSADISAVLVNAIRDAAYRAYRDSRYQAALDSLTGGTGETPTLVVGTDPVLARHLIVSGDTRTFGTAFEKAVIKTTLDKRMANKIVLTFTRMGDGPDPLSFGSHAWIPELTSTINVSRNGATIKESMVQPRTLHVNHCPILVVIDVTNLSKVLVDKITTPATDLDVSQPYLAGITTPTP